METRSKFEFHRKFLERRDGRVQVVMHVAEVEFPVLGAPRVELQIGLDHEGVPGQHLVGLPHHVLGRLASLYLGERDLAGVGSQWGRQMTRAR